MLFYKMNINLGEMNIQVSLISLKAIKQKKLAISYETKPCVFISDWFLLKPYFSTTTSSLILPHLLDVVPGAVFVDLTLRTEIFPSGKTEI